MELPVYRMTVDEVDEGVQFVALVDMPAIEKPFQAFAKTPQRFAETGERRVLTGPLMLADTPIFRKDDTYGEYYVVFDKATIRKIVQKYFKQGNQHNVKSYITDAERGVLAPKGYEDTPDGSWFGSFKVENDEVWENRHAFKGFSVEGLFGMKNTGTELEVALAGLADDLTAFLQHINPTYKSL